MIPPAALQRMPDLAIVTETIPLRFTAQAASDDDRLGHRTAPEPRVQPEMSGASTLGTQAGRMVGIELLSSRDNGRAGLWGRAPGLWSRRGDGTTRYNPRHLAFSATRRELVGRDFRNESVWLPENL
jgi:hypothetical protein